tara:strand:- start:1325 stop:2791 length:1467 start_codon:yes stop_codon:yes gene_type:complete
MKNITIIGSGLAGMSAGCYLAKNGYTVDIIDKNSTCGGRLAQIKSNGFTFDKGPSWYWMPDIFDNFFKDFKKKSSDFYSLKRLSPSYQFFTETSIYQLPSNFNQLCNLFDKIDPGSSKKLELFLKSAELKYKLSIEQFLNLPGQSYSEFLKPEIIKNLSKMNIFISLRKHIRKYFSNDDIIKILEFPSMFLGGSPNNTPGVYSLMNFADIKGGTWYPKGGMYEISKSIEKLAKDLGVKFHFNVDAKKFNVENNKIKSLVCKNNIEFTSDYFICNAEYPYVQNNLIEKKYQTYNNEYWKKCRVSPSAIIFHLGVSKKIKFLKHHNLFFDENFDEHLDDIYNKNINPKKPLFYVCCPSKTDDCVIPNDNMENLFILIPISTNTIVNDELVNFYYDYVISKIEKYEKDLIRDNIIERISYTKKDFVSEYNAYNGNAYGLANTLFQTANFKPNIKDKKIKNLYYCGHFTVPGPGLPPSLISGKIASELLMKN